MIGGVRHGVPAPTGRRPNGSPAFGELFEHGRTSLPAVTITPTDTMRSEIAAFVRAMSSAGAACAELGRLLARVFPEPPNTPREDRRSDRRAWRASRNRRRAERRRLLRLRRSMRASAT